MLINVLKKTIAFKATQRIQSRMEQRIYSARTFSAFPIKKYFFFFLIIKRGKSKLG